MEATVHPDGISVIWKEFERMGFDPAGDFGLDGVVVGDGAYLPDADVVLADVVGEKVIVEALVDREWLTDGVVIADDGCVDGEFFHFISPQIRCFYPKCVEGSPMWRLELSYGCTTILLPFYIGSPIILL